MHKSLYLGRRVVTKEVPLELPGVSSEFCWSADSIDPQLIKANCFLNRSSHLPTLWFIGDSHMQYFKSGVLEVADYTHLKSFFFARSGIAFPPLRYARPDRAINIESGYKAMKQAERFIRENLSKDDIVVIRLNYDHHFTPGMHRNYDEEGNLVSYSQHLDRWMIAIENLADFAASRNAKILLFNPPPNFYGGATGGVAVCDEQRSEWFNVLNRTNPCKRGRQYFEQLYKSVRPKLNRLVATKSNIFVFDQFSMLCPKNICTYSLAGHPLYVDGDHTSNYGGRLLGRRLYVYLYANGLAGKNAKTGALGNQMQSP